MEPKIEEYISKLNSPQLFSIWADIGEKNMSDPVVKKYMEGEDSDGIMDQAIRVSNVLSLVKEAVWNLFIKAEIM